MTEKQDCGSSLHGNFITGELRLSNNYSKVAYLKQPKSRIAHLFSFFFFSQPSTLTREVTQLKQPSIMRIFPKNILCLVWSEIIVYIECLPTISKQCAAILDAIFVEHVATHTMSVGACVGLTTIVLSTTMTPQVCVTIKNNRNKSP